MNVPAGARLGPYEVIAHIGAGGMGEVYRARDTRLGRTVAIKLLPPDAATDPDHRRRLEDEARTIARLSHPNICTLFDVGVDEGRVFLVMEFLQGQTLADRLRHGPLPRAEALAIAASVADALDRAHRAGIVHRDVKPANIMLTGDGPKLLDFGIATFRPAVTDPSATATVPATSARDVAGTLPYMAPEQLAAGTVDRRTDIFALGAVLYEMLTGTRAFAGTTPVEVLDAVVRCDPPPLPPAVLDDSVRLCLRKDPESRWQSAHDLAAHFRLIAKRHDDTLPPERRRPMVPALGWAALGILALTLVVWRWLPETSSPGSQPAPTARLAITFPDNLAPSYGSPLAISPDGSMVAVVLSTPESQRLFLRRLDRDELVPVAGTEGAEFPFFSPDGEWIGFWSGNRLRKSSVRGGPPVELANSPDVPFRGADWGGDTILFAPLALGPLSQVDPNGGAPRPATALDGARGEFSHRWPQVLPGGRAWIYSALIGAPLSASSAVMLRIAATGETRELVPGALYGRYLDGGSLLFARDGQMFVAPFDPDRLGITGEAVPIDDKVVTRGASGATFLSVATNGSAVFVKGDPERSRTLHWVDRTGAETAVGAPAAGYATPRLSPDGSRVAVVHRGTLNASSLWVYDLRTQVPTRLTNDGGIGGTIAWAPAGDRLLFGWQREGLSALVTLRADGTGVGDRILPSESRQFAGSWVSGDTISYAQEGADTGSDVYVARLGDPSVRPLVVRPRYQGGARISPDRRWVAYVSDESGAFEVYVTPLRPDGPRWKVSARGGQEPVWSADGRELFFRREHRMLAVRIDRLDRTGKRSPSDEVSRSARRG